MNSKTIQNMQYFVGRVCSVVTSSMNRSFDEQTAREHFAIRVREVGVDGVWGTHPYNDDMVSFFAMPHVISLHEEVELDPNDPEHAAMIKEYEEKTGKKLAGDLKTVEPKKKSMNLNVIQESPPMPEDTGGDTTFVDIENLERLAEQTKRSFDAEKDWKPQPGFKT